MKYTLYELLKENLVEIPAIQRDYAQGRTSATEIRTNFLRKIESTLNSKQDSLNLDFIYGYTFIGSNNKTIFVPLDGQQRLTTLWLILWYFNLKTVNIENQDNPILNPPKDEVLRNFSYETRLSSSRFFSCLVSKPISNKLKNASLSMKIKDSSWFMSFWLNDPTIISILNMIDSIDSILSDCNNALEKLISENKITFDYIDIKSDEFRLTDELYIKMNSRGLPISPFEELKAQLSDLFASKNTDFYNETLIFNDTKISYQQYFSFKIDSVWMDLFWKYRDTHELKTDECIWNYFHFIAEILHSKQQGSEEDDDEKEKKETQPYVRNFESLSRIFSKRDNALFLFNSLDTLSQIGNVSIFFDNIFSNSYSNNKVNLFDDKSSDLFYRTMTDSNFDVKHKVLFYSILTYCIELKQLDTDNKLLHFVRIVRNILLGTRRVNDSKKIEYRSNLFLTKFKNYSKFIDDFVSLISKNSQDAIYKILHENKFEGFSKELISAEKEKYALIRNGVNIFKLEDHYILQGNISCFDLNFSNSNDITNIFYEIWDESIKSSMIVRAILTVGDYSITTHEDTSFGSIRHFGSHGYWNRILTTPKVKNGVNQTKLLLSTFFNIFQKSKGKNVQERLQAIIDAYLSNNKVNDWRYYFIKYRHIVSSANERVNLFSWQDPNRFDINSLGNSGTNPLLSYHINPYIYALSQEFKNDERIEFNYGRYSTEISHLVILGNLKIYASKDGWKIIFNDDYLLPESIRKQFKLVGSDDVSILNEIENKDKIETAISFIRAIIDFYSNSIEKKE